jgi:hypothetical protein
MASEAWKIICSQLTTPPEKRKFKKMKDLKDHCLYKLGVKYHDFWDIVREAKKLPGAIPYRDGAPRGKRPRK